MIIRRIEDERHPVLLALPEWIIFWLAEVAAESGGSLEQVATSILGDVAEDDIAAHAEIAPVN